MKRWRAEGFLIAVSSPVLLLPVPPTDELSILFVAFGAFLAGLCIYSLPEAKE
jgi:hypothetical protein